ncbi:hypothetical protein BGX21_010139 [Mortierella sp. AD011]|nr:hypothetical protein BGX20_011039 [Mortierella sp. AD010]KAF9394997.1 hypothetical protein BGX21_010139 [Mortierella sp. AD011]
MSQPPSPPSTPDDYVFRPSIPEDDSLRPHLPKSVPNFFYANRPSKWLPEEYLKNNADLDIFIRTLRILSTARLLPSSLRQHLSRLHDFYSNDDFGKDIFESIRQYYVTNVNIQTHNSHALSSTVKKRKAGPQLKWREKATRPWKETQEQTTTFHTTAQDDTDDFELKISAGFKTIKYPYVVDGIDISERFHEVQKQARINFDNLTLKDNMDEMLAIESIWAVDSLDLFLPATTLSKIQADARNVYTIDHNNAVVEQLSRKACVAFRSGDSGKIDRALRDMDLSQNGETSETLSRQWPKFGERGEATFTSTHVEPFFKPVFPRLEKMELHLTGKIVESSKNRSKGIGLRPDYYVSLPAPRMDQDGDPSIGLVFEIKGPERSSDSGAFLKDRWKVLKMMKEELNHMVLKNVQDPWMLGCQVFGYHLTLFLMDLRYDGIYRLLVLEESFLPRNMIDVFGCGYLIEVVVAIKASLDKLHKKLLTIWQIPGTSTPPKTLQYIRESVLSPEKK